MTSKPPATPSHSRAVPRLALGRAAAALGVSAGSFDVMVREGVVPPPRIWHARKLWLTSELEAALMDLPEEGGGKGSGHFDGAAV